MPKKVSEHIKSSRKYQGRYQIKYLHIKEISIYPGKSRKISKKTSRKMSRTRIPTRKIYFKLHFAHFGSVKIKTCEYITGNIIFNLFWYQGCYPADMWLDTCKNRKIFCHCDENGEGLTSLTCVYTKGTGICPYVATSVKDVRKAEI